MPLWGQRLKRAVPSATYLEVSPAGHCPHHEAPCAVNRAIESSIEALEAQQAHPLPVGQSWQVSEADGRALTITHLDGRPRNTPFEYIDLAVWRLLRAIKSGLGLQPSP